MFRNTFGSLFIATILSGTGAIPQALAEVPVSTTFAEPGESASGDNWSVKGPGQFDEYGAFAPKVEQRLSPESAPAHCRSWLGDWVGTPNGTTGMWNGNRPGFLGVLSVEASGDGCTAVVIHGWGKNRKRMHKEDQGYRVVSAVIADGTLSMRFPSNQKVLGYTMESNGDRIAGFYDPEGAADEIALIRRK